LSRPSRLSALAILAVALHARAANAQDQPVQPSRRLITQAVDKNRLVVLPNNTRPEANARNDRGPVPDNFAMEHMELLLRLPPEKQQELDNFTRDQQDPKSTAYHKWLTPTDFKQRFSLAPEDIQTITAWLQREGFTVNGSIPTSIDFSGTAGSIRTAFHTEIHRLDVNGVVHVANMSDPQIPAAVAPAVVGVVSLNDFKPRAMNHPRAQFVTPEGFNLVAPADLATIYDMNPLFAAGYSGQGQTVVVLEPSDVYSTADWGAFRDAFGLSASYPAGSFTQVHPSSAGTNDCTDPGTNGAEVEAILDAEWASAAAPSAMIEVASCADTSTPGIFIALQNLVNDTQPPTIVSLTYGESEGIIGAAGNAFISALYEQAASEGISIFVSSGDQGAAASDDEGSTSATHGIAVSGFASTPYNVAVGGTDFEFVDGPAVWGAINSPNYGSALSYVPESTWDDSCANSDLANYMLVLYYAGSGQFGSLDFCNTSIGEQHFLTTAASGGGPSGCAAGIPATTGIVGGTCTGYAKPSWQSLTGNPNDGVRDIPDVSLFAGNGVWGHYYVFCWSDPAYSSQGSAPCTGTPDTWSGGGGTSFTAPIMAGIQALVNQKTLENRQGNPAAIYYRLAEVGGPNDCNSNTILVGCIFHDIQSGDTGVNCTGDVDCFYGSPAVGSNGVLSTSSSADQRAFTANFGWDFATGIGSVDAYGLAFNWPNSIAAVSGTPQTATILTPFSAPFVVVVRDPDGNPITGLTVTFTAPSTGASGAFANGVNTAVTDSSGVATSPVFTANSIAGFYTVQASAPSITGAANFSLENSPGAPANIKAISIPQSTAIGTSFVSVLVAQVTDVGGNYVNGVTVTFTVPTSGPSASFAGGVNTAATWFQGQADSPMLTANGVPGTYSVVASVSGITQKATLLLSNTATAAANIAPVSGTPQSAAILQTFSLALVARVTDTGGNPVNGAIVNFLSPGFVTVASGTFANGSFGDPELTNADGLATSTTFTANLKAGTYSVVANAFTGSVASYSMTNIAGPPAVIAPLNAPIQGAVVGTTFPYGISALVTDAGGNPLTGIPVTFSAPTSGASATFAGGSTYATVTSGGVATSPRFMANSTPGAFSLQASSADVPAPASFPEMNVDYTLAMHTPGTVQITRGTPATVRLDMTTIPPNTAMPMEASLICTVPGTLINAHCSATPPAFFPGQGLTAIALTIFTKGAAASSTLSQPPHKYLGWRPMARSFRGYLTALLAILVGSFSFFFWDPAGRRRVPVRILTLLLIIATTTLLSCGGGGGTNSSTDSPSLQSTPPPPPSPDTPTPLGPSVVTVTSTVPTNTGAPGSISKTITININVD
jgi:hypothetical protein